MTDASEGKAPIDIQPVSVDELIRGLPRSRRGGYVEDIVDEQFKDFAAQINLLVGKYNDLVKDYNSAAAAPTAAAPQAEKTEAPTSNHFAETEEENAERIASLYREAQRNAREFVDDARERGNKIVASAEATAEDLRASAHEEVVATRAGLEVEVASTQAALSEQVRTTREALEHEVRTTHEKLERDTEALNAVRDRLTGETQEIFIRLRAFHETQLETLEAQQASVRFTEDVPEVAAVPKLETIAEEAAPAVDIAPENVDTVAMDQFDIEDEPESTPVISGPNDAASEPEVFTPDEPQEAPEASVSADIGTPADHADANGTDYDNVDDDDEELTVAETGGGDPDDSEEKAGKKRGFRR